MSELTPPRPVVLAILDGFGESANPSHNAVASARMPSLDGLKSRFPHGVINASELHVGLPHGQMGNSEVGHMNIGSGRVLMQELPRIDQAIETGSLAQNAALKSFIVALKKSGGTCHLLGLISPGGVHAHQRHMAYLARTVAETGIPVHIHVFLDGRDTPPKSALEYLEVFMEEYPMAKIATLCGRYYAMDRDKRWDRVELAYKAIAEAEGVAAADCLSAIEASYASGKTDEFVLPAVIKGYTGIKDGDGLLMANFRADRAREILHALLDPAFDGFKRKRNIRFATALGAIEYSTDLNRFMATMFSPEPLTHILGEVIAARGLKQLHIAETEKYAHVTFFFNGGREEPFAGEERILVPSPNVVTYDLRPEMSAPLVTEKLVEAIDSGRFDFIVVNYANCDMVGHTGNLAAATQAVETVDSCIGKIWKAVERKGGAMIITADHGNAEQMHDEETHQPHTAHTLNLVPAILCVPELEGKSIPIAEGKLADLAPTVLKLMGIPKPTEMTGTALF